VTIMPRRRCVTVKDLTYIVEFHQHNVGDGKNRFGLEYTTPLSYDRDPAYDFTQVIRPNEEPTYIFANQGWTGAGSSNLKELSGIGVTRLSSDELRNLKLCHRTLADNLPNILQEGILPGGDKRRGVRSVHFTKFHPSNPKAGYRGREQATAVLELDMEKVVSLLGQVLGGDDTPFEFYETSAGCVLSNSGIPPCCVIRVSDAKSSMIMWRRPESWLGSQGTLFSNNPGRPRLLARLHCAACRTRHLTGTSVCFKDDCRRPITPQGVQDWCASFPYTERKDRMSRLVEFGFRPLDYSLSDFATGEREGRARKGREQQIFTKNWCSKKYKQATKKNFRSWAHQVDKDPGASENAEHYGFPRVLRHWNVDETTGTLKSGPEVVIYGPELDYLTETNTAGSGLIDPDESLPRPRSS
jgi:RNA:NAD 2'-phosphotransferase (TPT1/KptA family)